MTAWQTYEEVAVYLLNEFGREFGLDIVESKQRIDGLRSGTRWEIDGKGMRQGKSGFVIVECRRYTTSRQDQEKLGGLAYRISDTGAVGGILVSPMGFQEGAERVAAAEKIIEVRLDEKSTKSDFVLSFLNRLMVGCSDAIEIKDSFRIELRDELGNIVASRSSAE